MRENIIKTIRVILFLALGFFFLLIAFRDVHFDDLISGLKSASYNWVMISLLFATLALVSRSYRWKLLIEPLGYNPSAKNTFFALMTGYLANFILPRIGEITRCGSLNRTDRIPVDSLLGTVIIERISDLAVLLLLSASVFFIKIEFFGDFLYSYILLPLYQKIYGWLNFPWLIYIFIIAAILLSLVFFKIIARWLSRWKIFIRFRNISRKILKGMITIKQMEKKFQFLLHTIFIWAMYFLMTRAIFLALPSTIHLGPLDVLFILVIGGIGMAAPVQGGIGAYHWIVTAGLGLYGIPRETGLVFATLSHESQAVLMILLGSFSMFMVFMLRQKQKKILAQDQSQTGNLQKYE